MGFSVSASTAIIFAGLFLAVGILYPAVSNGYEQIQDAQVERDQAQLDLRNTAINITEATEANGGSVTVENTGTTSLTVSEVDLIVDGEYEGQDQFENDENDGSDLWLPGETITADDDSISDGSRVKVVTEHGISAATEVQ